MTEAGFETMVAKDREAEIYAEMKQQREPLVACVMLVNGREAMVRRAVASFRAQTYKRKHLLIYDSGERKALDIDGQDLTYCYSYWSKGQSIGMLRNRANQVAAHQGHDIIAHWDSDDLSHPNRLAEQVALLQASGAECVGYHQAVFWDERNLTVHYPQIDVTRGGLFGGPADTQRRFVSGPPEYSGGEAWIYTGQVPRLCAIGASLCYWRKTWERVPFDDLRDVRDLSRMVPGEDSKFVAKVKTFAISALLGVDESGIRGPSLRIGAGDMVAQIIPNEPRIICSIHGGSTVKDALKPGAKEWRRASELDAYCREAMRLELHK